MPRLEKHKVARVDSVVWCHYHGCVHDNTLDPYDYGYNECLTDAMYPYNKKCHVHRTIFVGLRKGDWHEEGEEF